MYEADVTVGKLGRERRLLARRPPRGDHVWGHDARLSGPFMPYGNELFAEACRRRPRELYSDERRINGLPRKAGKIL